MRTLSIESRMELSRALGAPIDGIPEIVEDLVNRIQPILQRATSNPREALMVLAILYLYFTARWQADDAEDDPLERAKGLLDGALLLINLWENE
jgi:hypothetical protein